MRRTTAVLATVLSAAALLSGCGKDEPATPGSSSDTIEITFSGDSVTPNGERVQVERGEEITLVIKAEEPGELHVHTSPEQEIVYGTGTTERTLTIDEPGVVDVEAHDLEVVVVQLEVS